MILVARRFFPLIAFPLKLPFVRSAGKARPPSEVTHRFTLYLAAGASEHIARADRTVQVLCTKGTVWITQDGELEDVILVPGESFTSQRTRNMLLRAMQESQVEMQFSR